MTLHPLDELLQIQCPTLMVPRYSDLPPLIENGHRFLMAGDGLYIEIRRDWLHLLTRVADTGGFSFPYGQVEPVFNLGFTGTAFLAALKAFIAKAEQADSQETAGWLVFDPQTRGFTHITPVMLSQGAAHVHYLRPDVQHNALPVVDCHSHGHIPAFFSGEDNHDDLADDLKIAFVIGSLNASTPTVAMRLVGLGGINIDLTQWLESLIPESEGRFSYDGCIAQYNGTGTDHAEQRSQSHH